MKPSEFNQNAGGLPLSPSGRGSYRMETDRYIGHVIYIMFKTDPAIIKWLVPEPLESNPDGLAFAKMYQLKRRHPDKKFREPAFSQYNEISIATPVEYDGHVGHYNLFMWVNRDWAMWKGREVIGWPKKLAEIDFTLHVPEEDQLTAGDSSADTDLTCTASRYGHRIVESKISFDAARSVPPLPPFDRFYTLRYSPSVESPGKGSAQLFEIRPRNPRGGARQTGIGSLKFFECPDEDLEIIQPREILGAYYFPTGWDLPDYPGRMIHEYSETQFEKEFAHATSTTL